MGTRRGNGEGSRVALRKDGRYQANYWATLPDGTKVRKSIYGKTAAQVRSLIRAKAQEQEQGVAEPTVSGKLTLGGLIEGWLDHRAAWVGRPGGIRAKTWQGDEQRYRLYVKASPLARMPVSRVRHFHLQAHYDAMLGRGLAPLMVYGTHSLIRTCLRWAYREESYGVIIVATDKVDSRYLIKTSSKAGQALSDQHLGAVLRALAGHPEEALWTLSLLSGARFCEVSALRWGDIDWELGQIAVNESATEVSGSTVRRLGMAGRIETNNPKTEKSRRLICLPSQAMDALRRYAADRIQPPQGWVFTTARGVQMGQRYGNLHWHQVQTLAGIPQAEQVRLHDTRHTEATAEQAAQHPELTQQRLGHSSASMTKHYQHVAAAKLQAPVVRFMESWVNGLLAEAV